MRSLDTIDDVALAGPYIYTASIACDLSHLLAEKGLAYFHDTNDLGECKRTAVAPNDDEIYLFTVQNDKDNFTNLETNNISMPPEESTAKIFESLGLVRSDYEIHYVSVEYELIKGRDG